MRGQDLEVLVLGPTDATRSGQPVPLGGHRRRALLTRLLLDAGRTVSAQTLLDDVWDDETRPVTRGTLQTHISELRTALGGRIGYHAGGYRLDLSGLRLDAMNFERALDSALVSAATGLPESARQLLTESLGLWRGDALQDVADRAWAHPEAARLTELRKVAEEQLLQSRLDVGEHQQLVADAEAAVADEPLREQRWATLVLALYRCGRQSAALAAYRRLRDLLAGEMGVDPSRPMVELQAAILRQDPRLDGPGTNGMRGLARTAATETLRRAHDAADAGDWPTVQESLIAAETSGSLHVDDLELLGDAGFVSGDQETSIYARMRAHMMCLTQADTSRAAVFAMQIVCNYYVRNQPSLARGWMDRAGRLLDGVRESAAHGMFAYTEGLIALAGGDPAVAVEKGVRAKKIGKRRGDHEIEALGQAVEGSGLARLGDIEAAVPLFEAAFAAACVPGRLGPVAAGQIVCWSTQALLSVAEYDRARKWIDVVEQSGMAFPGDCHVHRAEALRGVGELDAAAAEAEAGRREAQDVQPLHAGIAHYEMGMLHLASGSLLAAERSFVLAKACGVSQQPGAALVQLALGDVDGAFRAITAALASPVVDDLARARLLPAAVRIAVAAAEHAQAERFAASLNQIVRTLDAPGLAPIAVAARTELGLRTGVPEDNAKAF
ncbi:hypothetical protein CFN78_20695 [Amycolatopsis antarctica]|uniref:OmpR/PhoB-type domain-containing protein n=1 Tax=Amycolatopsis antarctica TaxID=1854586 RepID=A0A263CYI7_9PSEU|nr:AfsR/SARP family transcriptional regulator [Amycolatopsis antarctica]OZM71224.1 hypothetical protein CFN78_20695 [Amycolatopsis antarctica]